MHDLKIYIYVIDNHVTAQGILFCDDRFYVRLKKMLGFDILKDEKTKLQLKMAINKIQALIS